MSADAKYLAALDRCDELKEELRKVKAELSASDDEEVKEALAYAVVLDELIDITSEWWTVELARALRSAWSRIAALEKSNLKGKI